MSDDYTKRLREALRRDPGRVVKATMRAQPRPDELPPVEDEDNRVRWAIESVGEAGVDLSGRALELRALLREVEVAHDMALEDYERRVDPDKPLPGMVPRVTPLSDGRVFDFGDDVGGGLEDAEEVWEERFKRPRGSPKEARGGVPTAGLHVVFGLVRRWWLDNVPGARGFNPDFGRVQVDKDEDGEPIFDYDYDYEHDEAVRDAAAELLLCVAQELDIRYKPKVLQFQYTSFKRRKGRAKTRRKRHEEERRKKDED